MKCVKLDIRFVVSLLAWTLLVYAVDDARALAQPAVIATPSAPTKPTAPGVQKIKDVSPLTVPNTAPLATTDADESDLSDGDEDSDIPVMNMKPNAMPITPADIASGMNRMDRGGAGMLSAGAGSTPANANIPTAVTDVVNDLKRAEKNVTLEDVARAQDALARLDLLLDIEKKINEIERTRDERKNIGKSFSRESSSGGFGQVPASALNLPLGGSGLGGGMTSPFRAATTSASSKPIVATPPPAPKPTTDGYKVEQINGSNGMFRAVISDNGKKNTLGVGDKLGAFTVSNISAKGVTLTNDKDRKVLTVENGGVPMVVRPR